MSFLSFFPNQKIHQLPGTFYLRPLPYRCSLLQGSPMILVLPRCVLYSSQLSWHLIKKGKGKCLRWESRKGEHKTEAVGEGTSS